MGFTTTFSAAAAQINETMAQYGALYGRARSGQLDHGERDVFAGLTDALNEHLSLEVISPESANADLQEQLVNMDAVHEFGARSVDELKTYRLGELSSTKTALALVNPYGVDGRRDILAAIYLYWQRGAAAPLADYRGLSGNVHDILNQVVRPDRGAATDAVIFYSISTFNSMKGAGQMLISRLHAQLTATLDQRVVFSTLSPLRGLGKWLDANGLERPEWDDEDLRDTALSFLLDNRDGVQMFHMGNGAQIGDINLHANAPGSKDDMMGHNVMVNYVYSRDAQTVSHHAAEYARAAAAKRDGDHAQSTRIVTAALAPHLRDRLPSIAPVVAGGSSAIHLHP
jgi:hypothetical protein